MSIIACGVESRKLYLNTIGQLLLPIGIDFHESDSAAELTAFSGQYREHFPDEYLCKICDDVIRAVGQLFTSRMVCNSLQFMT
jgi:hypothetical protein